MTGHVNTQPPPIGSWGTKGVPLLPKALRRLWATTPLPAWLASELGLSADATMASLDASVWSHRDEITERVRSFLAWFVATRLEEIGPLRVLPDDLPETFRLEGGPFRMLTINGIHRAGIQKIPGALGRLTYLKAASLRQMGPVSLLDLACTAESLMPESGKDVTADPDVILEADEPDIPVGPNLEWALAQGWSELVSGDDPRFAALLPKGLGTLAEMFENPTLEARNSVDVASLEEKIARVRDRVEAIEAQNIDEAAEGLLAGLLGTDREDKRLPAVLSRLNWNGRPERLSLEEAGSIVGLTRERVRQLAQKAFMRMPQHVVLLPALDRALRLLETKAPISPHAASRLLHQERLAREGFHPASLIALADALHHPHSLQSQEVGDSAVLVRIGTGTNWGRIILETRRLARAYGIINVDLVASHVAPEEGPDPDLTDEIRKALKCHLDVSYLDGEEREWFWIPGEPRNPVVLQTKKMLSVTAALRCSDIREGLRRFITFRSVSSNSAIAEVVVPPRAILDSFFRQGTEFVIHDELVRSVVPIQDMKDRLAPTELTIVEILRSQPGQLLDRASLLAETSIRGLRANTVTISLSYSPVLQSCGYGYWTARGTSIDPAHLEALRLGEPPRERRVLGYGWTNAGEIWIGIRIPDVRVLPHPTVGVPSSIQRYLVKEHYEARTRDGRPCGRLRVHDGLLTGLLPFLRQTGADEGDVLIVEFDSGNGSATLSLDSDEEFDQRDPSV